jgi:hypothetical protein
VIRRHAQSRKGADYQVAIQQALGSQLRQNPLSAISAVPTGVTVVAVED